MSKKRDYLDMTKKSPSKMLKIPRSTGKVRDDDSSFSGHYQDSRVLLVFFIKCWTVLPLWKGKGIEC